MISYLPIKDDLNIVFQEIKQKKKVKKKEPVNHIWIYDRSGSMYFNLPELTKQIIAMSKTLPKGDTLTLGWFSSEGQFNYMLKGFKITDSADYDSVEEIVRANSSVVGLTCFSEILTDAENVIDDLSVISKKFSLHFFTDGYPVVSNYNREITNIFKAIEKINGKVTTAMIVGYGNYYNKELMTQMAEKLGALLIHSSAIPEYSNSVNRLMELSGSAETKEEIDSVVSSAIATYAVTDQGVVLYSIDENGKLYISPQSGKSTNIFYVTREKPNKKSWKKIDIDSIDFADSDNIVAKALYASALVLTQQTKTDIALEILGCVGDKSMVDSVTNAFTIEEYGKVEANIRKCVDDITYRFANGRDKNYLPPVDAFCVFDLLNILMKDDEASFFPFSDKFNYERIGVASKSSDEYPKFEADKNASSPFKKLVWHDKYLNLSVTAKINGKIKLNTIDGTTPDELDFDEYFPTYVYRNYTFIKDGNVNIKKFHITSSEKTYMILKNKGIVIDDSFREDGTYCLDISTLPAINRKIADGRTSGTDLCKLVFEEQRRKAQLKSLKYLRECECDMDEDVAVDNYSSDQVRFLMLNGVQAEKGFVFSPPVEREPSTDKYIAKKFKIKIAKLSTLPKVVDVQKKIKMLEEGKAKKDLTPVQYLIKEGLDMYENEKDFLMTEDDKRKWFDSTIDKLNNELKTIRSQIQETKFAIVLGKKWFDEFDSRAETALVVDEKTFNFELGEDAVAI